MESVGFRLENKIRELKAKACDSSLSFHEQMCLFEALNLALYYVEGDSTYEGVCERVLKILDGK